MKNETNLTKRKDNLIEKMRLTTFSVTLTQ